MSKILALLTFATMVLMLVFIIYIFGDSYNDPTIDKSCENDGLYYDFPIYFDNLRVEEVENSKVYATNNLAKTIDSTVIKVWNDNSESGRTTFQFQKKISTKYKWKIVLNTKLSSQSARYILVSNIKTKTIEERSMSGHIPMCYIFEWDVNGKTFRSDKFEGGDSKFILIK